MVFSIFGNLTQIFSIIFKKMKYIYLLFLAFSFLFLSCDKDGILKDYSKPYPTVTTNKVVQLGGDTVLLTGTITSKGGPELYACGFYFSTKTSPALTDNQIILEPVDGEFSIKVVGLSSDSTYYVGTYALNELGISKGTIVSFNVGEPVPSIAPCTVNADVITYFGDDYSNPSTTFNLNGFNGVSELKASFSSSQGPRITMYFNTSEFKNGTFTTTTYSSLSTYYNRVSITIDPYSPFGYGSGSSYSVASNATVYCNKLSDGTLQFSFCDLEYQFNNKTYTLSGMLTY